MRAEMSSRRSEIGSAQYAPTRVRRTVLGLTVAAYMITYMDRVVMSAAVPSIQKEFGFSLVTMGLIVSSFRWAYALFQIPGGWYGDWIGPRRAFSIIVTWWSLFTSLTAAAWGAASMAMIRFLFGIGEAGRFRSPLGLYHAGFYLRNADSFKV